MNTMELVHFVAQRTPTYSASVPKRTPQFFAELIGPVRQAVLRARQRLLSEQRDDGAWSGTQITDASLASQLVLFLAYQGREQSELAQQATTTILAQQFPNGGWSNGPGGTADVSTSVQAYFALKVTGIEPSDERLVRARHTIRELGGADAADRTTRLFLALLGQIDYDDCAVMPPEALLCGAFPLPCRVAQSLVWSHRPVRAVGIERGVRELFVKKPGEWPRHDNSHRNASLGRLQFWRTLIAAICQKCEQHGWIPLRRRALDRLEASLLKFVGAANIQQLSFEELLWQSVALHAIGYTEDTDAAQRCQGQLRDLIEIDDATDSALPQLHDESIADTIETLGAIRASGVSSNHLSIARAEKWLYRARRCHGGGSCVQLAGVLNLLVQSDNDDIETSDALPPDIEVRGARRRGENRVRRHRRIKQVQQVTAKLTDRLASMQNADGGWCIENKHGPNHVPSTPRTTAVVLEAIASADREKYQTTIERAATYLSSLQQANGSWVDEAGIECVQVTSLAVCALMAVGAAHSDDVVAAGVNWLIANQDSSGGWSRPESSDLEPKPIVADQRRSKQSSTACTASALEALVAARRADERAARRAVQFLVESQQEHGGWNGAEFVLRDSPSGRWYANELHAITSPLTALSEWAIATSACQPESGRQFELRLVSAAERHPS